MNISRSAYNLLLMSMAGNVAAISSGFKTFSTQMAGPLATPKVKSSSSSIPPTALPTPPGVSNTSGALSLFSGFVAPPLLPQLDRAKYPNIVHWFDQLYLVYCRGKQDDEDDPREKPSGSMLSKYMENEDGSEVPELTKKAVHKKARAVFEHLLRTGMAPTQWRFASVEAQQLPIRTLEAEFPFLQLCENHWKAAMVATNAYLQWYKPACGHQQAREVPDLKEKKGESSKQPQTEGDDLRPSKHPRLEEPHPMSRSHSKELRPVPRPRPLPTKVDSQHQKVCKLHSTGYVHNSNT